MIMDSLLCEEELPLSTPPSTPTAGNPIIRDREAPDSSVIVQVPGGGPTLYKITKEDNAEVLSLYLDKEASYMPQTGYVELLRSKNLLFPRFRAIQWLIKSGSRLSLSLATIFNAVNCLDRFLSVNQCHEWKHWMVELLSVACLAIASKFNETNYSSLNEIQLEDLDYSFQSATIQKMELILLESIGWRLDSPTAYSYVEILISKYIDLLGPLLDMGFVARVTDMLLGAALDFQLVEYRPSIVAAAAILCSVEELSSSKSGASATSDIMNLFNPDQQVSLIKCRKTMEGGWKSGLLGWEKSNNYCNPSSPVTVLVAERVDVKDSAVDLSPLEPSTNKTTIQSESIPNKRRKLFQ